MLQHGVTDEIAIPLILSGLGPENEWVKLEKSHLGGLKGRNGKPVASSRYPLFNRAAALLYPMDLNAVTTDPKLQKIFCLNNRCVYRFGLYPKQITHSVVLDVLPYLMIISPSIFITTNNIIVKREGFFYEIRTCR